MNNSTTTLCVSAESSSCEQQAILLAEKLAIPYRQNSSDFQTCLLVTPTRLELHDASTPGAVYVDFVHGSLGHRRQYGGGRKQPLARAAGIKSGITPTVIDATAGLGKDAFVLASLGCNIIMCERSPILTALIQDGLDRALVDPDTEDIASRMTLINDDASHQIKKLVQHSDDSKLTIYLDPMYPEKKKSALVKKEMQMLQNLIGPDMDSEKLLTTALENNTGRVVVKRPMPSNYLCDLKPTVSINSKSTRYDIYVAAAMTPE